MPTKPKRTWRLGLYVPKDLFLNDKVVFSDDSGKSTARLTPVIVGPDRDRESPDTIRNVSDHEDPKGLFLDGLEITARGKTENGAREVWYYDWAYKPLHVDRLNAARLARAVKTIDRRLDTMRDADGYVTDFPIFVHRMAKAIKADVLVFEKGSNGTGKWGYDGIEHTVVSVGAGLDLLRRKVNEWLRPAERATA